jgi:hypothetical protein
MVVTNICVSSVWNLHCVTLLEHCVLRWLLDFWKSHAVMVSWPSKSLRRNGSADVSGLVAIEMEVLRNSEGN